MILNHGRLLVVGYIGANMASHGQSIAFRADVIPLKYILMLVGT